MSVRTAAISALFLIVFFMLPKHMPAQVWSLDAYAGRANYRTLPASVSSTAGVLGIRFNQDRRIFQAALGLPLTGEAVTWGIVGLDDRFAWRRGGFAAGADVSVFAHAQRDPVVNSTGHGLQADLLPMVSQSFGTSVLELRSGPRWYGSRLGDVNWTRRFWTTEIRGGFQTGDRVRMESDVRHDRGPQKEIYTRVGLSLSAMLGWAALEGGIGHWIGGVADVEPEWDASITVPVRPGISIFSSAQRESFNPLFLGPTRTSWSAGITFRIGGRETPTPESAVVNIGQRNQITIRVPLTEAPAPLSIAGDFTGWKTVPMQRQGSEWRFDITLETGVYRFAFRTEDGKWIVPQSIPNRTDDGMGGWVAVLVVP